MTETRAHRRFLAYRRTGDPAHMARVFDLTAPRLLLVARHLTRDPEHAEDLVQTTFLHAIRDAAAFDERQQLLPWLTSILIHRAHDLRRRRALREHAPLPVAEAIADAGAREPLRALADRDAVERALHAVDALPEPYRHVLVLRLVHGLPATAIAHSLGRSPGTVRVQLKRGLDALRAALPKGLVVPAALVFGSTRGLAAVRADVLASLAAIPAATGVMGAAGGVLMKKSLMVLAAAGACALTLFLLPNDTGTPRVEEASAAARHTDVTMTAASGAAAAKDPQHDGRSALAAGVTSGMPAAVSVLVTADDVPVGDCELRHRIAPDLRHLSEPHRLAAARLREERWRTDANGCAAVAPGPFATVLEARAGPLYGQRSLDLETGEDPFRIALQRDVTLRVKVVDGAGRPVARACVLLQLQGGGRRWPMPGGLGSTGDDGMFVREHLQVSYATWGALMGAAPETFTLSAQASGAAAAPTSDAIAVDTVPDSVIVLRMLDVGRVVVQVLDHRGRPWPAAPIVPAHVVLYAAAAADEAWPRYPAQQTMTPLEGAARYAFEHVAVGARVRADVTIDGVRLGSANGDGPRAPGDEALLTVRAAAEVPLVTGRLLDGSGAPVTQQKVTIRLAAHGERREHAANTDVHGMFLAPVRTDWLAPGEPVLVVVDPETGAPGQWRQGSTRTGRSPPRPLRPGLNDLGEVRLEPLPLLCAGRIVDEHGAAVEDAVRLVVQPADALTPPPQVMWSRSIPVHVARAAGGTFRVYGPAVGTELAIDVMPDGRSAAIAPVRFTAGATNVDLVVPQARMLRMQARFDDVGPLNGQVCAELVRVRPPAGGVSTFAAVASSGIGPQHDRGVIGCSWQRLPPGGYELRLRLRGDDAPLLVRRDVTPYADRTGANENVVDVDLRPLVRVLRVAVADAGGNVFPAPVNAELLLADAAAGRSVVRPRDGAFLLPCAATPRSFTVEVPGFARASVRDVDADTVVRLAPPLAVALAVQMPSDAPLPEGVRVRAFLCPRDQPPGSALLALAGGELGPTAGVEGSRVDAVAPFTFALAASIEHRVSLVLHDSSTGREAVVAGVAPATIRAGDEETPRSHAVRVTAESLRAALAELHR